MRVLVFQHMDVEHPGVFRELWRERGYSVTTVAMDAGEAIPGFEAYDLLIVMGGGMDVWQDEEHPWLTGEKAAIRHWVRDLGKPYVGICLGHQLLAAALGGRVALMTRPEVGVARIELTSSGQTDPLLAGLGISREVLEWHGAEVTDVPLDAVILAANATCRVQAMRWGRWAYGFQFHPEITPATLEDWLSVPEYVTGLESLLGSGAARRLTRDVTPLFEDFRRAATDIVLRLEGLVTGAAASDP